MEVVLDEVEGQLVLIDSRPATHKDPIRRSTGHLCKRGEHLGYVYLAPDFGSNNLKLDGLQSNLGKSIRIEVKDILAVQVLAPALPSMRCEHMRRFDEVACGRGDGKTCCICQHGKALVHASPETEHYHTSLPCMIGPCTCHCHVCDDTHFGVQRTIKDEHRCCANPNLDMTPTYVRERMDRDAKEAAQGA